MSLTIRYLATFAPGFEKAVELLLKQTVSDASGTEVSAGKVLFSLPRIIDPDSLPFFNNIYLILREWRTADCPFPEMVKQSSRKSGIDDLPSTKWKEFSSFRVRYSKANQFCSVDRQVMTSAEQFIFTRTGLKPDRFNPGTEFWFIVRTEGWSCFALQLTRKQTTEKYLEKGELRPEIVYLMIALAGCNTLGESVTAATTVLDPFAGYGSIPQRLLETCPEAAVYISDNAPECEAFLRNRFAGEGRAIVSRCSALSLEHLADSSVDLIVTDPPWGFWENGAYTGSEPVQKLYTDMLVEFDRLLAPCGRICVLTGAKSEFEAAVHTSSAFCASADATGFRTNILVNGKKSAVFLLTRNPVSGS